MYVEINDCCLLTQLEALAEQTCRMHVAQQEIWQVSRDNSHSPSRISRNCFTTSMTQNMFDGAFDCTKGSRYQSEDGAVGANGVFGVSAKSNAKCAVRANRAVFCLIYADNEKYRNHHTRVRRVRFDVK